MKNLFVLFAIIFCCVALFVNQPTVVADEPGTKSTETPDQATMDAEQYEGIASAKSIANTAKANATKAQKDATYASSLGKRLLENEVMRSWTLPDGKPVCRKQAGECLIEAKAYVGGVCQEQFDDTWAKIVKAAEKRKWIPISISAQLAALQGTLDNHEIRITTIETQLKTCVTDAITKATEAGDKAGAAAAEKMLAKFEETRKQFEKACEELDAAKKSALTEYKAAVERYEIAATKYSNAADKLADLASANGYADQIKKDLQAEIATAKDTLAARDRQIATALANCKGWRGAKVRDTGVQLEAALGD